MHTCTYVHTHFFVFACLGKIFYREFGRQTGSYLASSDSLSTGTTRQTPLPVIILRAIRGWLQCPWLLVNWDQADIPMLSWKTRGKFCSQRYHCNKLKRNMAYTSESTTDQYHVLPASSQTYFTLRNVPTYFTHLILGRVRKKLTGDIICYVYNSTHLFS